jgi:hypothetical protein
MNNVQDLPLPDINKFDTDKQNSILKYLKQLDTKEQIAYKIAMEHLGSSFHIIRSNGYQEWLNKNK